MRNIFTIFKKELLVYINSPMSYIIGIVFLLITGWFFTAPLFLINRATIEHLLNLLPLLFLFFVPSISMRLIAEELKLGTIELLTTSPIKDYEIIIGKFLASFLFIFITVTLTIFYSIYVSFLGTLDWGRVFTSYFGIILLLIMYLSIGIFASSLTKNQIITFIIAFLVSFTFFLSGKISELFPVFFRNIFDYIGIDMHLDNFQNGLIDSRDVIYFCSVTLFFLFLSTQILSSRKWR